MNLRTGTSGYAYPQWRGSFYPDDLSNDDMLAHYAAKLATVEINNTFYRMPKPAVVANWVLQAPAPFEFVIKASQRITHQAKLVGEDARSSMQYLFTVLGEGGLLPQLAAVLLQTPPYIRASDKTLAALEQLCAVAPAGTRLAFELQHDSWRAQEVADILGKHNAVSVIADKDDGTVDLTSPVFVSPSRYAYVRLRRENYTTEELQTWLAKLSDRGHDDVWVFFKHEDTARGAEMAVELAALARLR
jgi:uncharacterized protein YecE (DUF72 family)